jgi:hypothetical protein
VDGKLFLAGSGLRPPVRFVQLAGDDKIQWTHTVRTLQPLEGDEALVYEGLAAASRK